MRTSSIQNTINSNSHLPIKVFLILVVLVPIELGFYLGPLFFTWSKAYLFLISIPVLWAGIFVQKLENFDILIILHVVWSFIAYVVGFGFAEGIERGGTYTIDFLTVYFMGRLYIRSFDQIISIIRLLFLLVLIATIPAIPEAILKDRFIHDFARSITGNWYPFSNEERLGMLRAASFFEHPILFGIFCAALFSLTWFTTTGIGLFLKSCTIAVGTFFGLSSAPLLVLVAQVSLVTVERSTRWLQARVKVCVGAFAALVALLEFGTNRGAISALTVIMLNPDTAWYRKAQITYTMDDILRHPVFGIGRGDWTRPHWLSDSLDNHFILIAMRSGLPSLLFFVCAIYMVWAALARIKVETQPDIFLKLCRGWGLTIVALVLTGMTVAYFGRMQPLLAFYISIGASLATIAATNQQPSSSAKAYASKGNVRNTREIYVFNDLRRAPEER